MKIADSGMPEESYWESLFDIPLIIDWLNLQSINAPIVEIGCGYGTFTAPVAQHTQQTIFAFDIDTSMIEASKRNVEKSGRINVHFMQRDVLEQGTGLDSGSVGMVLLFNILHFAERRSLLEEAFRILNPFGIAAIIHWRKDVPTPRGPAIDSRPDENMILESMNGLDFRYRGDSRILEPYHFGIQLIKGTRE